MAVARRPLARGSPARWSPRRSLSWCGLFRAARASIVLQQSKGSPRRPRTPLFCPPPPPGPIASHPTAEPLFPPDPPPNGRAVAMLIAAARQLAASGLLGEREPRGGRRKPPVVVARGARAARRRPPRGPTRVPAPRPPAAACAKPPPAPRPAPAQAPRRMARSRQPRGGSPRRRTPRSASTPAQRSPRSSRSRCARCAASTSAASRSPWRPRTTTPPPCTCAARLGGGAAGRGPAQLRRRQHCCCPLANTHRLRLFVQASRLPDNPPPQVDQANIDILLVGDSAGMVVHGHDTTLPITLEQMLTHCQAVARGAQRAFLVRPGAGSRRCRRARTAGPTAAAAACPSCAAPARRRLAPRCARRPALCRAPQRWATCRLAPTSCPPPTPCARRCACSRRAPWTRSSSRVRGGLGGGCDWPRSVRPGCDTGGSRQAGCPRPDGMLCAAWPAAASAGGSPARVEAARAIVEAGVAVMGHVGLTPQSVSVLGARGGGGLLATREECKQGTCLRRVPGRRMITPMARRPGSPACLEFTHRPTCSLHPPGPPGGFRPQAQVAGEAMRVLRQAQALQAAGCFSVVLECVPGPIAAAVTKALAIPTIGIGAGPATSGQVRTWGRGLGRGGRAGVRSDKRSPSLTHRPTPIPPLTTPHP
jgi:ketopantoate hydroxymethyltransferase